MMEDGLRASVKGQPDDKCPSSDHKCLSLPAFSDAPIPDHLPPKGERSAIPPLQPDLQGQVQYALGAGLEKGKEVKIIPHVQQVEDSRLCVTLL